MLTAAWIGHGTYLLLVRKSWRHVVTGILLAASFGALVLMLGVMSNLDSTLFDGSLPLSEQYKTEVVEEGDTVPAGAKLVEVEASRRTSYRQARNIAIGCTNQNHHDLL